ncbi:MAG: polysaccharide biosynthesis/export family protein, partial [Betaproteobacteria bacterium]
MRRSWVAAALAAASMALALPATAQAPAARAPEVTMPAVPAAEYRLGVGDVLRITVFQNPELTLESRLNEGGVLSFPLIGSVRLGGLSVPEAERLIADSLARGNFLRNPQ